MAIGDVYKLTANYTAFSQQLQSTFYFAMKSVADPTAVQLGILADDLKNAIRPQQVADFVYQDWQAIQVRGALVIYSTSQRERTGGLQFEGTYTGLVAGGLGGVAMPPKDCLVVTLLTGNVGRSKRGRHYHSGLGEADHTAGLWVSSAVGALQSIWDALLVKYKAGGTSPDFEMGVWSDTTAYGWRNNPHPPPTFVQFGPPAPGNAFTALTAAKSRATVYSQRRRTIGVGR